MRYEISLVGFLVLLTAGRAFADPPKNSSNNPTAEFPAAPRRPTSEKQRLSLVEKGKALTRDGHYPEALAVFREALEVRPDPKVLLWVGYAQEQTGTLLEAKASYLEAKSIAHAGKLTGEEENADQALGDIAAKIPRITLKLSPGVEAKLWIDGKPSHPLWDGAEVDPGPHSVIVSGPEWHPYKVTVVAKLGGVHVVEPVLTRIHPPAPAPSPAASQKIASDSSARALIIAGAATTAVGAAMGTGFAILSEVKRSERDAAWKEGPSPCYNTVAECEPYNAPERARGRFLTVSLVSFLAAGVIGAGTLTYTLVTRTKESKGRMKATASVGAGRVAGAIEISW